MLVFFVFVIIIIVMGPVVPLPFASHLTEPIAGQAASNGTEATGQQGIHGSLLRRISRLTWVALLRITLLRIALLGRIHRLVWIALLRRIHRLTWVALLGVVRLRITLLRWQRCR